MSTKIHLIANEKKITHENRVQKGGFSINPSRFEILTVRPAYVEMTGQSIILTL
jgi:hypothetical protein